MASTSGLVQRMRYMLAVGPPRSEMTPLKLGPEAMVSTSRRMEPSERLWMALPWCMVMEQNVQPPKQPRMTVTESRIMASAGMGFL